MSRFSLIWAALLAGYLLLRGKNLQLACVNLSVAGLKEWRLRRAKKKFEVYLRKQDSKRGPWVH